MSAPSSSRLLSAPPGRASSHSLAHIVPIVAGSRNTERPVSASLQAAPAEHDVDDECPTLRSFPMGRRDPSPATEGAIVYDESANRWHALLPGDPPVVLGDFSTHAQAQHRLSLHFGRPGLTKTGVREKPEGSR